MPVDAYTKTCTDAYAVIQGWLLVRQAVLEDIELYPNHNPGCQGSFKHDDVLRDLHNGHRVLTLSFSSLTLAQDC